MAEFIPYGHQSIDEADIRAVTDVLRSDFLTQGPMVPRFEQAFAERVGADFACACSSGTAALHLAALAFGIGTGDLALVPAITFAASANAMRLVGATVEFVDVDPATITICPDSLRTALERAHSRGKPARAVVTVDFAGHPCDMGRIHQLKEEFGFVWIQDACHALGAAWTDADGQKHRVGGFPGADAVTFSFHPVKHVTTGEGGMLTTHRPEVARRAAMLRSHGITRDTGAMVFPEEALDLHGKPNPWYYEMQALGLNYRLTDLQAALGLSQLQRRDAFLARRHDIATRYREALTDVPGLKCLSERPTADHAWHLFVVRIDYAGRGSTRAQVMEELRRRGIGTQGHYIPLPMMPFYSGTTSLRQLPQAVGYYREALTIPCFPGLSGEQQEKVVHSIREVLS